MTTREPDRLQELVRSRYAEAARVARHGAEPSCGEPKSGVGGGDGTGAGCAPGDLVGAGEGFGARLYDDGDRTSLPEVAHLSSLGCGNPTAVAELREGDTVLDLGSGGGIDVLLSARRVGSDGHVYGLDMTEEMVELARDAALEAGARNVEFLLGEMEAVPLPDACVDVIISNCVINLSVDKPAVLAEMHRVLVPGGRVGVSDVVAEDRLRPEDRAERGTHVGCIAGALSVSEYRDGLVAAGFEQVELVLTHEVADGLHGAIVRAVKAP